MSLHNNLNLRVYRDQGNYAAAELLYERALKIREKTLGPDNPDTAASLDNLAELCRAHKATTRRSRTALRARRLEDL